MTRVLDSYGHLPVDQQHPELFSAAISAIEFLEHVAFAPTGDAFWAHHDDFATRSQKLTEHLTVALECCAAHRFNTAFTVVRTALEHQVLDQLLLLGVRYRQRFPKLSDQEFARWQQGISDGADWAIGVEALDRTAKGAVLTRRGYDVTSPEGQVEEQISPYWHFMDQHQPTLGPPSIQADFFDGIGDIETLEEWARKNRDNYAGFLRWAALLDNLVLNDLLPEEERVRLQVHYRFLSAFTHASDFGYKLIHQSIGAFGTFSPGTHCLSELVLLYVGVIAASEINALRLFADRRKELVTLDNRRVADRTVDQLDRVTSHLWFVGQEPREYDRFMEANKTVWRDSNDESPAAERRGPNEFLSSEVGYYDDPLGRLHQLHVGGREGTTGFGHPPQWR